MPYGDVLMTSQYNSLVIPLLYCVSPGHSVQGYHKGWTVHRAGGCRSQCGGYGAASEGCGGLQVSEQSEGASVRVVWTEGYQLTSAVADFVLCVLCVYV